MPNYTCYKHHLHWFGVHYLRKASCDISVSFLEMFLRKGGRSAKIAKIMKNYVNQSLFRKIIFDLQTTIDRVHPVQI